MAIFQLPRQKSGLSQCSLFTSCLVDRQDRSLEVLGCLSILEEGLNSRAFRTCWEFWFSFIAGSFDPAFNSDSFFLFFQFGCGSFGMKGDSPAAEDVEVRLLH